MLDKEKLLEWVRFGLERAEVLQATAFKTSNKTRYDELSGGTHALETLRSLIETGHFDASNKELNTYDGRTDKKTIL